MEMSVGDARDRFAEAVSAVERGERVTITRDGRPVALLGPLVRDLRHVKGGTFSMERNEQVRRELGLDKREVSEEFLAMFDNPALSRRLLGLPDDWKSGGF